MSPIDQQILSLIVYHYARFAKLPAQAEVETGLLKSATRREYAFRVDRNCLFLLSEGHIPDDGYAAIIVPVVELPEEVYEPSMAELRGQA